MFKKLAALAGAGALLLGAALPAFALFDGGDVAIIKKNQATAEANTGGNLQGNYALVGGGDDTSVSGNNSMSTGNASAYAGALVVANTHIRCGCDGNGGHVDFAYVKKNKATALANTGVNEQGNGALVDGGDDTSVSGDNSMSTGDASSTARAYTIVNTHWGWGP